MASASSLQAGIFQHHTPNIGDDMQAYACLMHLAQVDQLLDRDRLAAAPPGAPAIFIANSWFLLGDDLRTPPEDLRPVWHGFRPDARLLVDPAWQAYLREQRQPIGCRDLHVTRALQACGIPAYFSGCITLFLGQMLPLGVADRDGIVFLDVPESALPHIPPDIRERAVHLSTFAPQGESTLLDRLATVAELVVQLARAELVVTRRLHAALPAAGLGTPVLAIPDPAISFARERFNGFESMVPTVFTDEAAVRLARIDWSAMAPVRLRPDLAMAHTLLCNRLRKVGLLAQPWSAGHVLDRIGCDRVRVGHALPQWPRASFRLRLDSAVQPLPVRRWTGAFVDVALRCFPGLSRISLRVEARAHEQAPWEDLGALGALATGAARQFGSA